MPLNRRETIELANLIEERRAALAAEIRREVARARHPADDKHRVGRLDRHRDTEVGDAA